MQAVRRCQVHVKARGGDIASERKDILDRSMKKNEMTQQKQQQLSTDWSGVSSSTLWESRLIWTYIKGTARKVKTGNILVICVCRLSSVAFGEKVAQTYSTSHKK